MCSNSSRQLAIQPGIRPMANITRIHVDGNADGPQQDTGIKIDVGIEVAGDEIVVFKGLFFQFQGNIEQRILLLQFIQHFVDPFF